MEIKKSDKIKVEYEGKLEDGTVFDTSKHGEHSHPLEFEVGSGQVIKGFDEAVLGMKVDEEKEFTLKPEEAYGNPNPEMERKVPLEQLPKEPEPKEGMMLMLNTPEGQQFPAKIIKVEEKEVTIDLNHPLAGKTLTFKIKIVGINETKEQSEEKWKEQ